MIRRSVLAALLIFGLSSASWAASELKVATSSTGFLYATAYIADQMGYFRDANLKVEIFDGGGGSNAVAGVVGGSAHFGVVGIKNMSEAVARGVALKAIGAGMDGFPMSLVVRSDLLEGNKVAANATLKQRMSLLKGATVAALDIGGSSGGFVRYLLTQADLPKDYVTLINMNNNAGQLASLKAKRIDGFVNTSPIWETAVADGYGADLVVPARDIPSVAGMTYIVHAVRDDFLKENGETVEKYLTAIYRAQLLVQREPEKAKQAFFAYMSKLSSKSGISEKVRDIMWERNRQAFPATPAISREALGKARAFFDIKLDLRDEQLVDNTLAQKIAATAK